MEHSGSPPALPYADQALSAKRKRSASPEPLGHPTATPTATAPPPAKTARPNPSHLQINYLARQYTKIIPLITIEDPLPTLLSIINDYEAVLQRHESMAGNMGARPLGPMLVQRFERLFDGPPRVLKHSGKEGVQIGWLDVVEFARSKPEQFNLEKMRDGVRVCQFYTKQCRVEISEEDYMLIASGMPQRLIPPQPIEEDEEKELGTLEILEKKLGNIVLQADQVSARARQLNHRLKNRKSAIMARREAELGGQRDDEVATSPVMRAARTEAQPSVNGEGRSSVSPTSGFTAVNSSARPLYSGSGPELIPRAPSNGSVQRGASAATRAELLSKFHTSSEQEALAYNNHDPSRSSISYGSTPPNAANAANSSNKDNSRVDPNARPPLQTKTSRPGGKPEATPYDYASTSYYPGSSGATPVAIPNTPSSLLPYTKPPPGDRFDDSGPYRADMMLRMEQLNRGDRVQPPCDRCRRLHMDCLKNLTACMGCTKKHAKCSWKDVVEQELKDHPFVPRVVMEGSGNGNGASNGDGVGTVVGGDGTSRAGSNADRSGSEGVMVGSDVRKSSSASASAGGSKTKDWSAQIAATREVRDEELLGESSEDDEREAPPLPPSGGAGMSAAIGPTAHEHDGERKTEPAAITPRNIDIKDERVSALITPGVNDAIAPKTTLTDPVLVNGDVGPTTTSPRRPDERLTTPMTPPSSLAENTNHDRREGMTFKSPAEQRDATYRAHYPEMKDDPAADARDDAEEKRRRQKELWNGISKLVGTNDDDNKDRELDARRRDAEREAHEKEERRGGMMWDEERGRMVLG